MRRIVTKFPLLALAIMLAATLGITACSGGGGGAKCDADSAMPNFCDADEACHECCIDDHCASDEVCDENYECVPDCLESGADCASDRGACCEGSACSLFSNTCIDACTADADCATAHADVDFAADLQCQSAGYCDFQHCSSDDSCRPNTVCYNGDCVTPADCTQIASCNVVPGSAVTQNGTTVSFAATALLTSGALAPGASFTWASDDSDIASVAAGVVTGGANTGSATITATVAGCATTCTANVTNYGAVDAANTRVVVVDELTGMAIEGINVAIHDGATGPVITDGNGVAEFVGLALSDTNPQDLTVSDAGYNYVTMVGVEVNDIIVHLGEQHDPTMAGGYKGSFDFSKIICEPGNPCEVKLGFAGSSIPGNLFNLNLDVLIGELILTHIELGGTSEDITLPGGLVVGLNDTFFGDDEYWVTGVPGTRVAWALGGKLNLADLIEILGPVISGGELDIGLILASVLPMFSEFYTAMIPNVEIDPIAKVADVDDINANGETDDLVPNYAAFPALPGGDMVLKVPMDQTVTVSVGNLPSDGAGGYLYDSVIVLAGVLVRDAGLVPLGLSAGMDGDSENAPDGVIDNISLSVSDVAGRLPEGQYERVVVALAINMAKLTAADNTDPLVLAGQVHFLPSFSGTLSLNDFMEPAAYTYDAGTRTASITALPAGIDYLQMLLTGDTGSWQVLHPAATGDYTMPAAPAGGDRADGMGMVAIKMAGGVSYQDLLGFNATNMADLVSLVSDFVVVYDAAGGGLSFSCATGSSHGSLAGLALMLMGLAWLRRRQ